MTTSHSHALLHIHGRVATLTLNRPEARNALSADMLRAATQHLVELRSREDLSVLILTGAGKAFCAGMDLKAVLGNNQLSAQLLADLAEFTLALRALPLVTLARVNGAAIGGGCGLACVCDLSITYADAKLGFPEVDLGVCPAVVAPWVVKKIGHGRARAVLLSGGLMSGTRAHELGIVDRSVASIDDLDAAVTAAAEHFAAGGPHALRATKDLLNQLDGMAHAQHVRDGAKLSASILATSETQATLAAKMKE